MQSRRRLHIREKAEALLQQCQITEPEVPVEKIAERYGITVRVHPIDDDNISGFLARQPGRGAIIGVNSRQVTTRRRFTIAHELGHYFLHANQGQEQVHIDVKLRGPASSQGTDQEEVEANRFAAELLMPVRFITRDFSKHAGPDDDKTVAKLAEMYGVSSHAMSIRLDDLGLLAQQ